MHRVTATLSVLVAKVVDHSRLCRDLGRDRARLVIGELFCDLAGVARSTNGETLQATEDRMISVFMSADDAVAAAATMHRLAGARPQTVGHERQSLGLDIRIATGTVLREGGRLFGEAVNWAMDLETGLGPHRTLISETTVQYLSREKKNLACLSDRRPCAGGRGMQKAYEYTGDEEDITWAVECQPTPPSLEELDIILGPVVMTMGEACPLVTIGRLPENDLFLKYPRVSRKHARIEKRPGKFVLVDTSFNGTYVQIGNLDIICVKHAEIALIGNGIICPGRKASSSSPGAIHFALR
jgi:adenylate cyclase